MVMPEGVSGVNLAEWLLADRPDLKIIFTSGYSHPVAVMLKAYRQIPT